MALKLVLEGSWEHAWSMKMCSLSIARSLLSVTSMALAATRFVSIFIGNILRFAAMHALFELAGHSPAFQRDLNGLPSFTSFVLSTLTLNPCKVRI